jgi:hypothetical protein
MVLVGSSKKAVMTGLPGGVWAMAMSPDCDLWAMGRPFP